LKEKERWKILESKNGGNKKFLNGKKIEGGRRGD